MTVAGDLRTRVCRAMWAELNCWMHDFALTAYAIPRALLAGELGEETVTDYPQDHSYPEQLSRAIAHTVGLPFSDEPDQYPGGGGWLLNVGAEAVGIGIEALLAIPVADIGVADTTDGGTWQFYAENLAEQGVTINDVRTVMQGLSLRDAAQLLVDAHGARP